MIETDNEVPEQLNLEQECVLAFIVSQAYYSLHRGSSGTGPMVVDRE